MIDPFFGHGTFIAGLIRQNCPDADILSLKVMSPDGIVEEADLLTALDYLADRQLAAQGGQPELAVDVVSLSLGYYHEEPEDYRTDGPTAGADRPTAQSRRHRRRGCRQRQHEPRVPAGRAYPIRNGILQPPAPAQTVADIAGLTADRWPPLISVGALNPDNSVALFSNGGTGSRATPPAPSWSAPRRSSTRALSRAS